MIRYLQKKLGIERQEKRIDETLQEIEKLKEHITHIQNKKPKVIKQTIYKRPKNDPTHKKIDELESINFKTNQTISEYKKTFLEFVDIVTERLENLDENIKNLETRLENKISQKIMQNQQLRRPTKRPTKGTTSRPIVTTKRPTNITSTTDKIEQGELLWANATNAEREIIKSLYDTGYPASYNELAKKLDKSVSTVKNHLNNMKAKGFKFQERTGLNNTKKYLLDNRVKTFLTLRLND